MIYSIWADTHIYGANPSFSTPEEFLSKLNPRNPREILVGDIVDLTNCQKDKVNEAREFRRLLKDLYGVRYFDGNHEATIKDPERLIIDGILFTHLDQESWGYERAYQYRSKNHGASEFKRRFIGGLIESYEKTIGREPDTKLLRNCVKSAKMNKCHTIVGGHLHPKELIDVLSDDVRIIICPRGNSKLEL